MTEHRCVYCGVAQGEFHREWCPDLKDEIGREEARRYWQRQRERDSRAELLARAAMRVISK
jgi:hypothetical protein